MSGSSFLNVSMLTCSTKTLSKVDILHIGIVDHVSEHVGMMMLALTQPQHRC